METQKCAKCGVDLTGYDLVKARINQKLKPEVKEIYCNTCLPMILQKQKLEKARKEVGKLNSDPIEKKRYSDVVTKR